MASQTILWTALPHGTAGGVLRLAVLVSPRLESAVETKLDKFPDFLLWPRKKLTFEVSFTPPAGTKVTRDVTPSVDRALWATLFDAKTTVRGFKFAKPLLQLPVQSYPVLDVLAALRTRYLAIASDPGSVTQFPSVVRLAMPNAFGQLAVNWQLVGEPPRISFRRRRERADAEHRDHLAGDLREHRCAPAPGHFPDFAYDTFLTRDFNACHNPTKPVTDAHGATYDEHVPAAAPHGKPPTPDFHQTLAALADHPELMRRLGLVIELEILTQGIPPEGHVSVAPASGVDWQAGTHHVSARTAYGAGFRPLTRSGSDLVDGMLDLSDAARFGVVDVDVDGAVFKVTNLADSLACSLSPLKTQDTPETASLPSLREAGLAIVRKDKAASIVASPQAGPPKSKFDVSLALQEAVESGQNPEVFADDVVRGYRIDVTSNDGATWHSLCERDGVASFQGSANPSPDVTLEDEGWVSPSATTTSSEQPPQKLFVGEPLARWNGWSLVAPRPGQHIGRGDVPTPRSTNPAATDFSVSVSFDAKNLPRLRFGRTYRLRARAVDLAGNGVLLSEPGTKHASPPFVYRRYTPVSSPTIVLHEVPEQGEAVARLVIRSFNDDEGKDGDGTLDATERHVAPPQAAQLLAEAHGKFDGLDPLKAYAIAADREGTYDDTENPRTGAPYAPVGPAGIELVQVTPSAGGEPYQVAVHHEDKVPLPYLPDPLARGVAFLGMPKAREDPFLGLPQAPLNQQTEHHSDGTVTKTSLWQTEKPPITLVMADFGPPDAWPDALPLRLRAVEGSEPPAFDKDTRVLTVDLPKATIARTRMSTYIDKGSLQLMGIWGWIQEEASAAHDTLRDLAFQGRHWMLTPWRELVLVHAVQQPIGHPTFAPGLRAERTEGATHAMLRGALAIHERSTGRVDVEARWIADVIDRVEDAGPTRPVKGAAHAFDQAIEYPDPGGPPGDSLTLDHRHDFGDTRHRMVKYRAVSTSRFREYFAHGLAATRTSSEVEVDVPSSARPPAPHVVYVVPTFGWERSAPGASPRTAKRTGGGLRVYLERPWFSSGDDELLGVVLSPVGRDRAIPVPSAPDPYVTRWGGDPIRSSPIEHPSLVPGDFRVATATAPRLRIAELPDDDLRRVAVVGHPVTYDERRRLWFCDIVIDPGPSYFPFVRLALARYQPHSIHGVELSRIVVAEFSQLTPDRSASLTIESPTQLRLSLLGVGLEENAVKIEAQHLLPGGLDELSLVADQATIAEVPSRMGRAWTVTLPPPQRGAKRRIAVRELEQYAREPGNQPAPARLVYAEVFEID